MARNKIYNLRLTNEEWESLTNYAATKEFTVAEVLRDYIKGLSKPGRDRVTEKSEADRPPISPTP